MSSRNLAITMPVPRTLSIQLRWDTFKKMVHFPSPPPLLPAYLTYLNERIHGSLEPSSLETQFLMKIFYSAISSHIFFMKDHLLHGYIIIFVILYTHKNTLAKNIEMEIFSYLIIIQTFLISN